MSLKAKMPETFAIWRLLKKGLLKDVFSQNWEIFYHEDNEDNIVFEKGGKMYKIKITEIKK